MVSLKGTELQFFKITSQRSQRIIRKWRAQTTKKFKQNKNEVNEV